MRGDIEILAYNLIEWAGGELPWMKKKLLGTPVKVQKAKDELMSNIDTQLKVCFPSHPGKWKGDLHGKICSFQMLFFMASYYHAKCLFPIIFIEPIAAFLKFAAKLKYDEKPDYEKCRKYFLDGLKAIGKTNSGDLEFKILSASTSATNRTATTLAAAAATAASPLKQKHPKIATSAKAITSTTKSDEKKENISPKPKPVIYYSLTLTC